MAEAPGSSLLSAYRAVTSVVAPPLSPLILAWRVRHGKEDPEHCAERRGIASRPRPEGPLVWVHAASVGETVSVLPLIGRILADGRFSILLTTGTITSTQIANARLATMSAEPGRAIHQYVPHDGPHFVRRFLDHWKPGLAIFVESEIWPNLIVETARTGARMALVNARMSDRSFRRWLKRAAMIRALLSRFDVCLAQSAADAERLVALGAERVVDTGNLKYDAPAPPADETARNRLAAELGERPRWLAASLHSGEDEPALDAHRALAERRSGLVTLIAPRHPERAPEIEAAAAARGLKTAMRSRGEAIGPDTDVYVFDTIGEMGLAYRLAPIVLMGGSLVRHGGQNPIEPAKLATAILHGPNVHNFADVYAALHDAGGADEVADAGELAGRVGHFLDSPDDVARHAKAANTAVAAYAGALDRSMEAIEPLLAVAAKGA